MKRYIKRINSTNIEDILRELDRIELEENSPGFIDMRDLYECPESAYLGTKCSRCSS